MSKIEAIIFDMEGVVVDTESLWDEVAKMVLGKRGFEYDREKTKPRMMGTTIEGGAAILKELYGIEDDVQEIAGERRDFSRQLLSEIVDFVPGFLEFYEIIRRKYKTAIATSAERVPLTSIDNRLKLTDLFNGHIYSIEDIGFIPKPNPDIYLYAAAKLGVKPSLSVGIEDSPNGIEAINRAGMKSIAITTSTIRERLTAANLVVDSFTEVDLSKL